MGKINPATLHLHLGEDLRNSGWSGQSTKELRGNPEVLVDTSSTYAERCNSVDVLQYSMSALSESLLKKFHNNETDNERDAGALSLFLEANRKCSEYRAQGSGDPEVDLVLGEFEAIFHDFWFPTGDQIHRSVAHAYKRRLEGSHEPRKFHLDTELLNLSSISYYFGLGGGANIGSSSTDFYTKLVNSTMATTDPNLHVLFMHAISNDDLWADVEAYRLTEFGLEVVRGNRLSYVPKSAEISRTICTEPLLNMLFQKGIGRVIEYRLRQVYGIDLAKQPDINREMARLGSIDGRYGTIDLKSASDSISLAMLERFMPRSQLKWLKLARSSLTVLPDGREEVLHMVSSMGNGFTFPLQTAIFACLVQSVYTVLALPMQWGKKGCGGKRYGVFGDDIIVIREAYDLTVRALSALGFTVNETKSFNTGQFRESCGRDYVNGHDVRGVYLKALCSPGDVYSAINRLNRWSAKHGIPLPRAVSYLRTGCRFIGVPYDEADDAGIKVPLSYLDGPRRDRNGAVRYLASVNVPRMVRLPSVRVDDVVNQKHVDKVRRVLRGFDYNADGILLILLAGFLRSGKVSLRSESSKQKTVLRKRVTPGWDNMTFAVELKDSIDFGSWERATVFNLEG